MSALPPKDGVIGRRSCGGAPKNTLVAVVDRLNNEINLAISDSAIKARLVDLGGLSLPPNSPADFAKFIADETHEPRGS
jgi:hypothetical protein